MHTKSNCKIAPAGKTLGCLLILAASSSGCQQMAIVWANLTGGETIEAQYTLTKGPLFVFIDDRDGLVDEPKAIREVHATISEIFRKENVNHRVIPFADWRHLQQSERKYRGMTIQAVGEKLGADQVLYVRIDQFSLQSEAGAPLFKGEFIARVKVLSTEREVSVIRLWPREERGHRVAASTRPVSTDGDKTAADVADELGKRLGWEIAGLFYDHKEFADK
ncbi:MAG: hypothetical protein ACE5EC_05740 [Phycisphaerae bacterium]